MGFDAMQRRGLAGVVTALFLSSGCMISTDLTAGVSMTPQHIDLEAPAGWGEVEGFVLPTDTQPFEAGKLLRFYTLIFSSGELKEEQAGATPLERSLSETAMALHSLRTLPLATGLTDITGEAAGLGVTPAQLAPQPPGGGKQTQPNRIMALATGPGAVGYFAGYMPVDWMNSALTGHLHCLIGQGEDRFLYAQSVLGGFDPGRLSDLLRGVCETARKYDTGAS